MALNKKILLAIFIISFVAHAQAGVLEFAGHCFNSTIKSSDQAFNLVKNYPYLTAASAIVLPCIVHMMFFFHKKIRASMEERQRMLKYKQAYEEARRFGVSTINYINAGCNVDRM